MRIDLPSGGWAELRAAIDVPEYLRRPVKRAAVAAAASNPGAVNGKVPVAAVGGLYDAWDDMTDKIIAAFVSSWSFEGAVDVNAVRRLGGGDYDALAKAVEPLWGDLLPDFGASKEAVEDPKG